jgi:hypothetical protein
VITAVVYALASIPTFLFLRERALPRASVAEDDAGHVMRGIATKLARSMRELRQYPDLRRFFWAGLAYQAGLAVVITLASVYAEQALGFKMADTIKLLLVVNVSAAIGAFLFGYVQDHIGHKPTLAITRLLMWIATVVIAYVWHTQTGLLGGRQSGRTLSGRIAVWRAGTGRHPEPAAASCGVLRLVGPGGAPGRGDQAAAVWHGDLGDRRQPSSGAADYRWHVRDRPCPAGPRRRWGGRARSRTPRPRIGAEQGAIAKQRTK